MNETDFWKQFEQRMVEGFTSVKELIAKSEDMNRERMADIKHSIKDHDKRLIKLEASLSYNVGKIAGISAAISAAMTIVAFFIKGGA